ncbi:MAG: hypothetical protein FJX47_02820 [Alphaproteobacteria bacterium]|nr:hypothetical protein [Alphaproteobacteria bacterium]
MRDLNQSSAGLAREIQHAKTVVGEVDRVALDLGSQANKVGEDAKGFIRLVEDNLRPKAA